jgi:hypothetical protein
VRRVDRRNALVARPRHCRIGIKHKEEEKRNKKQNKNKTKNGK